jgi:hypothetical protein
MIQQGHILDHTSGQVTYLCMYIANVQFVLSQLHLLYKAQEQQDNCGIVALMGLILYYPHFCA